MRTMRQRNGAQAEQLAVQYLERAGWLVVNRNVRVGRDEIDIMAVDPGPPAELVFVEVRSATSDAFGAPEERIGRAKVRNLYRAMRSMPARFPLQRRIDLVVVDSRGESVDIRHLRCVEPV